MLSECILVNVSYGAAKHHFGKLHQKKTGFKVLSLIAPFIPCFLGRKAFQFLYFFSIEAERDVPLSLESNNFSIDPFTVCRATNPGWKTLCSPSADKVAH